MYAISDFLTAPLGVPVGIDIKPGSAPTCNGSIPVAVLGSAELDVTQINPATLMYEGLAVRIKGNGDPSCTFTDVNGDGYMDLVCKFQGTVTEGTLTGRLVDETMIQGTDLICVAN